MPNANAPRGLVPVRGVNSQYVTGGLRAYAHAAGDAVALFVGDPVTQTGEVVTINGAVLPVVAQGATGGVWSGVVVGVLAATRDSLNYVAASTEAIVLVDDDPNSMFEIQDVNSGTALTTAAIGLNANIVIGTGSTFTGLSGAALDNTTEAVTATLDLKIVDFVNRADNEPGAAAKYYVRINRHRYANQIAGI